MKIKSFCNTVLIYSFFLPSVYKLQASKFQIQYLLIGISKSPLKNMSISIGLFSGIGASLP